MKIGFCAKLDRIKEVAEAGFDYIEPPVSAAAAWTEEEFEKNLALVKSAPIPVPSFNVMFPGDMALTNCTSRIGNPQNGLTIAVQGVTYVYDGSCWISQGASYPEWAGTMSLTGTQKYNTWATKYAVSDSTAAMREAYLLNCANTADAVAAAKAAFKPTSITINADGTVDVGLPAAPDGGFNGTVTVLGCETIDGEYHALTDGTFHDSLYSVPAGSNDRFFKAALDL